MCDRGREMRETVNNTTKIIISELMLEKKRHGGTCSNFRITFQWKILSDGREVQWKLKEIMGT